MRLDTDLHKNMYHYDSDEGNKENYEIMNRFDFENDKGRTIRIG